MHGNGGLTAFPSANDPGMLYPVLPHMEIPKRSLHDSNMQLHHRLVTSNPTILSLYFVGMLYLFQSNCFPIRRCKTSLRVSLAQPSHTYRVQGYA